MICLCVLLLLLLLLLYGFVYVLYGSFREGEWSANPLSLPRREPRQNGHGQESVHCEYSQVTVSQRL